MTAEEACKAFVKAEASYHQFMGWRMARRMGLGDLDWAREAGVALNHDAHEAKLKAAVAEALNEVRNAGRGS